MRLYIFILTHYNDIVFPFAIDSDGNYGYIKAGADTVTPFKTGGYKAILIIYPLYGTNATGFLIEGEGYDISNINTFDNYNPQRNSWTNIGNYFMGRYDSSGYNVRVSVQSTYSVGHVICWKYGGMYKYAPATYTRLQEIYNVPQDYLGVFFIL